MADSDLAPIGQRAIAFLTLLLATLLVIYFSINNLYSLYSDLKSLPDVIRYSKVGFYGLGAGLVFSVITIAAIVQEVKGRRLNSLENKPLTKALVAAAVLMFILPLITEPYIKNRIEDSKYIACNSLSTQWLFAKTIVYTDSKATCEKEVAKASVRTAAE